MKSLVRLVPRSNEVSCFEEAKFKGCEFYCSNAGLLAVNTEHMKKLNLKPSFYKRNGKLYLRIELKGD